MTNARLSIFNQLKPFTVGFDQVFDQFDHLMESDFQAVNFPPYNIVKTGDFTYDIELALAGFGKGDIIVDYADNVLTVKSKPKEAKEGVEEDPSVLHRGISKRQFKRNFTIADDVEVKGAELKDGLLKVSLEKIVPEGKKPRTIDIS
jgi:molecular chaperone IbpA